MSNDTDQDWTGLIGQQVQVWKDGRLIRTGFVEDVSVVADGLWLENDGLDTRAIYERANGYTVKPLSEEPCHS